MNIPEPTHPIWPIARVTVVLAVLALCLTLGYSSAFDSVKDLRTIVIVGSMAALTEVVKRLATT